MEEAAMVSSLSPSSPSPAVEDDRSIGGRSPPETTPPPQPEQPHNHNQPLLLRRLSSRIGAPPPPPVPAPEPPPPPSAQPVTVVKRVRFADQQPRALICSSTWWRGCLRAVLSPTERRARLQAARNRLEFVLRGRVYFACIVLLTVYVLVGDQLRLATLPPSADPPFRTLNTLAFLLLLLEMLTVGWAYEDYFLHLGPKPARTAASADESPLLAFWRRLHGPSFFFWLDALGVVLLPFDPTYISFISSPGNPRLLATNASQLSDQAVRVVRALRATSFLRLLKYAGVPSLDLAACCAACCCCCCVDEGYGHEGDEEEEEEDDDKVAGYVGTGVVISERPRRRGSKTSRCDRGRGQPASPMDGAGADEDDRLATAVMASLHRKVVIGGLLLLTLAPFLDYAAEDTTWVFLFAALGAVAAQGNATALAGFAALLGNVTNLSVGRFEVNGITYLDRPKSARCRPDEYVTFVTPAAGASGAADDAAPSLLQARAVVDASALSRMWAWESILLTLAVLIVFWSLAASLRGDLDRLVFAPLDQMVRLVRRIARNPLAPIREAGAGDGVDATGVGGGGNGGGGGNDGIGGDGGWGGGGGGGTLSSNSGGRRGSAAPQGLETELLLQTIGKIGALMRIGLGAAGADIISRNLVLDAAPRPEGLDLRMAGKLVSAVFVFCDVRNFTDATECLQEEVMVFVNKIAAILHELTVRCGGAPNKNVGDAFLLIWKVAVHEENEDEEEDKDEEQGDEGTGAGSDGSSWRAATDPEARTRKALAEGPQVWQAAGGALYCVLKFAVELARLHAYVCRFSNAASQRLYARLPGYRVGVGFGLHVGWAVEGPIGSTQKIDVSYVSPHVTAAEYLQDLTKEYGCAVLISEAFFHALPPVAQYNCRQVDCVRSSAAASSGGGFLAEPMSLYTYDCDPETTRPPPSYGDPSSSLRPSSDSPRPAGLGPMGATGAGAGDGRQSIDPLQSITVRPYSDAVWDADPDLQHIATKLHPNFRATWNYAMSSYLAGEWASARRGFETTLELTQGRDGPSQRLLAVLEQHEYKAPPGWAGFRELDG